LRFTDTVVIDKRNNLVRGVLEYQVPRARNIRPLQKVTSERQTVAEFFKHRLSLVGRSIINHHDLVGCSPLAGERLEHFCQIASPVTGNHSHGDAQVFVWRIDRDGGGVPPKPGEEKGGGREEKKFVFVVFALKYKPK